MSLLLENYRRVSSSIPSNVTLVAISKTKPTEAIQELYNDGQLIFGENKVQELVDKYQVLPKNIQWHLVGHLQTNKVKYIVPFVSLIHSVDSLKLLSEINKQAIKSGRIIAVLLQVYIAREESKFGLDEEELDEICKRRTEFPNVKMVGLMGMATFTDHEETIRSEFRYLKSLFDKVKNDYFSDDHEFTEISMGMSGDYEIAIEEGSTMVRVGSSIFGSR